MINLSEYLNKIEPMVYDAGKNILSYIGHEKSVEYKGDINLVTIADKTTEKLIYDFLHEKFPEDSIMAEEGNFFEGASDYTWVVDPLDGTTSFAHNFPFFAVSIGLINKEKQPVLGVVYNPFFNEYFSASLGSGAFLNNNLIKVSNVKNIAQSLIGTGFPYNRREIMNTIMKRLQNVLYNVHDVRRTGSAALDIVYVAAGRLDGYYEQGLQPWDVAGGLCILREAGGHSSSYSGDPINIFCPETVVSNRFIHNDFLKIIME